MLDEKDLKILEALEEKGDATTRQLTKKTLLPPTTIHNRIKKLKKEGVIKRFTIDVDPAAVGKAFKVYVLISTDLPLLKQKRKTQYDIAKQLGKFGFVERVDIVAGGTDIIAVVRVKGVHEFDEVLLTKIQCVEGISSTQSLTVIHEQ